MSGLWLEHPEWLWLVSAGVVGVGAALAGVRARSRRRLQRLLGERMAGRQRPSRGDLAILAALALIALALLGPRIARREVTLSAAGIDIVVLVDVSRSMDAADPAPSRLARARRLLAELLPDLDAGDRVALAGFAGRGVLLTPLSGDHAALAALLPGLDTRLVEVAGSELGAGVEAASRAWDDDSGRARVLLVLSDGETSAGLRDTGEVAAQRAALRVVAVAFGSEAGAPIPDHGAPLRDAAGSIVVSRRRTSALARLASASGGELLLADAWGEVDRALLKAALYRGLTARSPAAGDREARAAGVRATRVVASVRPFAALAALLLLAEALPRRRRGPALVAMALLGAGLGAAAGEGVPRVHALFERALSAAGRGDFAQAEHDLRAASLLTPDASLAALAHYDLGVLALEQGQLEAARDHFFAALERAPGDREAGFNAEWTLRELARGAAAQDEAKPQPAEPTSEADETRDGDQEEKEEKSRSRDEARAGPSEAGAKALPELAAAERARWLERIEDDPARALRAAVTASPASPARGRAEIGW